MERKRRGGKKEGRRNIEREGVKKRETNTKEKGS